MTHTAITPIRANVPAMRQVDTTSLEIHAALSFPPKAAATEAGPHVCPACRAPFVTPIEALEVDEWHFAVVLECPNCAWEGTGVYDDEALERFDIGLDEGTRTLMAALDRLALANAAEDFERFISALNAGALLPEDF